MAGLIKLDPGPPTALYLSDGIRLRSQPETNLQSIGQNINPTSGQSYYSYVKATNTGLDSIGGCPCSKTGLWVPANNFIDTPPPTVPMTSPDGATKLVAVGTTQFKLVTSATNAPIGTPWPLRGQPAVGGAQGLPTLWEWSPDGQFFAVVVRDLAATGAGGSWTLSVYATRSYTRGDGIKAVPAGLVYNRGPQTSTDIFVIEGLALGWNLASTCLILSPPPLPNQPLTDISLTLVCPYADSSSNIAGTWDMGPISPASSGLSGWKCVHSPCGYLVALVPIPIPNQSSTSRELRLIDIHRTLKDVQQKVNNINNTALVDSTTTNAMPATLTTVSAGRKGITLGHMSLPAIDNPECASTQAATISIRRVRVSTLPSQIDYSDTGPASVAILPAQSLWVEFPKMQWINPAQSMPGAHYCLQAMGDASPDDPSPGWAQLNLADRHYAQRNIVFA